MILVIMYISDQSISASDKRISSVKCIQCYFGREEFVKGMVEALNLPENDYPSMKDIESVLILNRLPARACENRNLYKFFWER